MTLALTLTGEFDIESYSGLKAFLAEHLQLDQGTIDELPTLIRLAELRLARLILSPERETTATLTTVAGSQGVSLPADFAQARTLVMKTPAPHPLSQSTPQFVNARSESGLPNVFAIAAGEIIFGPVPDGAYSLTLTYLAKLVPLSDAAPFNWLLAGNADAYVYMCAAVIERHLGDNESAALYLTLANEVIAEINAVGVRARRSVPARLRSPVVV